MPDEDLISIETGRYVNVQSMIFKFIYERSPLFTEQVLVIPIILVFFGEFDGLDRCCSDFPNPHIPNIDAISGVLYTLRIQYE